MGLFPELKKKRKNLARGSVCIFLSLVMLPVMTFGGMLTDAAKIQSAKLCIEGASELALNAALSCYDRILFDVYGLFALSDDIDALERSVAGYYRETIEGFGFFEAGDPFTREFINAFFGVLGEDTETGGILKTDAEGFSLISLPSSSLANPNVLENQIVEYMKYRGPVEIGEGVISKISCLSEVSAQTKVLEKKLKCEKKLSAVGSASEKVYGYVTRFNSLAKDAVPPDGPDAEAAFVEEMKQSEELCLIMGLFAAVGNYSEETRELFGAQGDERIVYPEEDMTRYEKTVFLSESVEKLFDDAEIKRVLEVLEEANGSVVPAPSEENTDKARDYLIRVYGRLSELRKAHVAVSAAHSCSDELLSLLGKEKSGEYAETAKKAAVLSELPEKIENYAADIKKISEDSAIAWGMNASASLYDNWYLNALSCLEALEEALIAAGELAEQAEKAESERQEWKKSIDALSESTVKVSMYTDYDNTADGFGKEEIEAFLSLLRSRIASLETFVRGIEKLSFIGINICAGNAGGSDCRRAYERICEKIGSEKSLLTELYVILAAGDGGYADELALAAGSFSPVDGAKGFLPITSSDSVLFAALEKNSANTGKAGDVSAAEAENFKSALLEKANKKSTAPTESAPDAPASVTGRISDAILGRIDELADYADVKAPSVSVSVPSGNDDGEDSEAAAESLLSASSFLEGIKSVLNTARDDLFVEEYITGMFSCLTDTAAVKERGVTSLSGEDISGNAFFGSEIEYILFGGDNPERNVAAAEALIFAIRFALNTLYAMTSSEIRGMALAAATSIAGWTGFGVPVVENVIIVSWALAESAVDLQKLAEGESVALYKSRNTWFLGPGGGKQLALELAGEAASKAADSIFDSVDLALSDGSADAIDSLHSEIDDYFEKCIDNVYEQVKNTVAGAVESFAAQVAASSEKIGIDKACSDLRSALEAVKGKSEGVTGDCLNVAVDRLISEDLSEISVKMLEIGANSSSGEKNVVEINELLYGKDGDGGIIGGVKEKIVGYIGETVDKYAEKTEKEIVSLINKGTSNAKKQVKEKLNGFIDGLSGDEGKNGDAGRNTVTGSFFSMNYREYLKLFLLMNYGFSKNSMLARTARLIQINVSDRENGSFDITDAPTCVSCVAGGSVPTLFIGEYIRDPDIDRSGIYEGYGKMKLIEYSGISGY